VISTVFVWVAMVAFAGRILSQLVLAFSENPNAVLERWQAGRLQSDQRRAPARIASLLMAAFWLACLVRFWGLR
jgi:hypothetical protein